MLTTGWSVTIRRPISRTDLTSNNAPMQETNDNVSAGWAFALTANDATLTFVFVNKKR
jgi:hypothetical protein